MENHWLEAINTRLENWRVHAAEVMPNLLLAIVVLILFYISARLARKFSRQFVLRLSKSVSLSGLLSSVVYALIIIFGFMTALDILKLEKTVSSLLAGVGIIGLALGFAFQDLTTNFISGAFIAIRRPFEVGHTVETNGFLGTIEHIQLRSTTLRTAAGLHVIIPNKDIFQKPIINYSRTDQRRVEIEFNLPNTVDAVFVEKLVRSALNALSEKMIMRRIEFYFTAIENANMRMNVSFWTTNTDPQSFMKARHRAIVAIYQAFSENKIYQTQIPQPKNAVPLN
jgi:small conductance mechanosensitive channel